VAIYTPLFFKFRSTGYIDSNCRRYYVATYDVGLAFKVGSIRLRANQAEGSPLLCLWHMHTLVLRSLYETAVMSAAVILVSDGSQRRNNPVRRQYPTVQVKFCRRQPDGKNFTVAVGYPTGKVLA